MGRSVPQPSGMPFSRSGSYRADDATDTALGNNKCMRTWGGASLDQHWLEGDYRLEPPRRCRTCSCASVSSLSRPVISFSCQNPHSEKHALQHGSEVRPQPRKQSSVFLVLSSTFLTSL